MFKKICMLIKSISCTHVDTRYRLNGNRKYKYVDICTKCGSKRYVK